VDDSSGPAHRFLDVNGLAPVKSGNVSGSSPKQGAPQTPTRTIVGAEVDPALPGDEVVTVIVALKYVSAAGRGGPARPFVAGPGRPHLPSRHQSPRDHRRGRPTSGRLLDIVSSST